MAGHYAPHGGNMFTSAYIRGQRPQCRLQPHSTLASPPGSPAITTTSHGSGSGASEPLRATASLQRWLRTQGAPDALRLLRAVGASARSALDDVEQAAAALAAEVPDEPHAPGSAAHSWSLWALALRVAFWAVFAILAVVRWLRQVRARAARNWRNARKRAETIERLNRAVSYAQWVAAAEDLDVIEGRAKWKKEGAEGDVGGGKGSSAAPTRRRSPASRAIDDVCDLDMLTGKLLELSRLYNLGDVRGLAFALRASLQRNYAGICHPEVSNHARIGTSHVVEDYVNVMSYLLAYIAQSDNARESGKPPRHDVAHNMETVDEADNLRLLTIPNKLLMFNEARIAYGRTALMLSGGASMGLHHLGVVKALLDQNLMPKVVCGTSAGALVASIVGIFDDADLTTILSSEDLGNPLSGLPFSFRYFDEHTSISHRARRLLRTGVIQDVRMLQDCLRRNYGDITFQEAYTRTRRILNITVCAVRAPSDPPMLLNYLTAPHVLVWSAAAASCALPFVFAPVELQAKSYDGRVIPYHPNGVKWIDGSITSDVPMARIGELFNVNHFIVSQTNPHIIPRGSPLMKTRIAMLIKSELQFRYWQALQLNLVPRALSAIFPHFMQPYEGDVTIFPEVNFNDIRRLLQNPTIPIVKECIRRGEQTTFPLLDRIRRQCIIEKALDASVEHVARMQGRFADPLHADVPHSASIPMREAAKIKRGNKFFGRVPSWLWLDPSSLLSVSPTVVANRLTAAAGGGAAAAAGASAPSTESDSVDGARTPEMSPLTRAMRLDGVGSPAAPLRQQTEFDKLWIELGVNAAAEKAAAAAGGGAIREEGAATRREEPASSGDSEEEEERVMC